MKRIIKKVAVLALAAVLGVAALPATSVKAADQSPLHTKVTTSGKGDDLKITYQLTLDKTTLSDGQIAILYDAEVLSLTKDSEANLFTEKDVNKKYVSGGKQGISIAFINDNAKVVGGTVATLKFDVKAGLDSQETVIQTAVYGLNNEDEEVLNNTVLEDAITVGRSGLSKPSLNKLSQTLIGVNVEWTKDADADGYEVYRSTSPKGGFSKIATVRGDHYWDVLLLNGKTYYYKVKAYQGKGANREYSEDSATLSIKVKKFNIF